VADGKGSGSLGHGLKNEKKTDETAVIREKKKSYGARNIQEEERRGSPSSSCDSIHTRILIY
jgi:hypothetical protein